MSDVVVQRFQAILAGLADAIEAAVTAIWAGVHTWRLEHTDAIEAIVAVINRGNASATGLADVAIAAQIEAASAVPVLPVGLAPLDGQTRLTQAVHTILVDSDVDTGMQLSRLARAEPLSTAQTAAADALVSQPLAAGWVRELNPGACELCRYWYRDGHVWPADHTFQHHPGCNCAQRIVLTDKENRNG